MTARSLIITFTDTDGDEFPIRVPGECDPNSSMDREAVANAALTRLDDFIEDGELIPSCPVRPTMIESPDLWRVNYATGEIEREES